MRWVFVLSLLVPFTVQAQDLEKCFRSGERIVRVDTAFFESFSAGGSVDLPPVALGQFDQFIRSTTPAQYLCFRGTADTVRWNPRYSAREWYRVNHSLAESRAHWAWERAGRRGNILEPFLNHPRRGVFVYRLTVEAVSALRTQTPASQPTPRQAVSVEKERPQVIEIPPYRPSQPQRPATTGGERPTSPSSPPVLLGVGIGVTSVSIAKLDFAAPTISILVGTQPGATFTLVGGWRPRGENEFGKRYETLLAGEFVFWPPRSYLGLALGAAGAWRVVRDVDEYLERAYGPFSGLRLLVGSNPLLIFGADAIYANADVFGGESRWEWGFLPSARMSFTF